MAKKSLGERQFERKFPELSDTSDFSWRHIVHNLLYAEARMGEKLAAIPDKKASSGSGTCSLPPGIDKKQSHYAHRHPSESLLTSVGLCCGGDLTSRGWITRVNTVECSNHALPPTKSEVQRGHRTALSFTLRRPAGRSVIW